MLSSVKPVSCLLVVIALGAALLVGCGGSSSVQSSTDLGQYLNDLQEEQAQDLRPRSVVREWPEKFCSLKLGDTRAQVREVMGEPTGSFSDSAANQDQWSGFNVELTAFYDIDDRVIQLDDSIGTSDLPCASSRQ